MAKFEGEEIEWERGRGGVMEWWRKREWGNGEGEMKNAKWLMKNAKFENQRTLGKKKKK